MTREITSHKANELNEALKIEAFFGPGLEGACSMYRITPKDDDPPTVRVLCDIDFQEGPIGECGVNGISNEALLAIVEDRLRGFQSGPFARRENALALTKLQEAMMWLQKHTRDRVAKGVEGTLQR